MIIIIIIILNVLRSIKIFITVFFFLKKKQCEPVSVGVESATPVIFNYSSLFLSDTSKLLPSLSH